jgi:hypothetical protein
MFKAVIRCVYIHTHTYTFKAVIRACECVCVCVCSYNSFKRNLTIVIRNLCRTPEIFLTWTAKSILVYNTFKLRLNRTALHCTQLEAYRTAVNVDLVSIVDVLYFYCSSILKKCPFNISSAHLSVYKQVSHQLIHMRIAYCWTCLQLEPKHIWHCPLVVELYLQMLRLSSN